MNLKCGGDVHLLHITFIHVIGCHPSQVIGYFSNIDVVVMLCLLSKEKLLDELTFCRYVSSYEMDVGLGVLVCVFLKYFNCIKL